MSSENAANERLVTMVLAEQMAALGEQIGDLVVFERLMACAELLTVLVSQIERESPAAATAAELDKALDDLALLQAQQQDLARQTADLVGQALRIVSIETLSLGRLNDLYVSDQQRRLHEAVVAMND
jgi:hypothetical protein